MTTIINALFDGKVLPNARKPEPSPEKDQAIEEWQKLMDAWNDSHDKEEQLILDRIISANNYVGYFSDRSAFTYGFQLATLLMMEVFACKGELVRKWE